MVNGYNLYNFEAPFKEFLLAGNGTALPKTLQRALRAISVKNYLSDFRHFIGWYVLYHTSFYGSAPTSFPPLTPVVILSYRDYLADNHIPRKTINRRLSTVRKFCDFCVACGLLPENPAKNIANIPPEKPKVTIVHDRFEVNKSDIQGPTQSETAQSAPHSPFSLFRFTIPSLPKLGIFAIGASLILALFGISSLLFKRTTAPSVLAAASEKPERVLSYVGKLKDKFGNPIISTTKAQFNLYSQPQGGTALYSSGTCTMTPQVSGDFSIVIGRECGSEIPGNIFSDNQNVYLGITVATDQEMSPRQQIANVGFTMNAQGVGGLTPGTKESNLVYINKEGVLLITSSSPKLESTSGDFTIQGEALNLTTTPGRIGKIRLSPGIGGNILIPDGNVGIGSGIPAEKFTVGDNGFQVDTFGNIVRINNIPYSFPLFQGTPQSVLVNDGFGNLSWSSEGGLTSWAKTDGAVSLTNKDDRVGLGTGVPKARLGFLADTKAEGGIDFGGDTNLYRVAADTLRTDDTFTVGGALTQLGTADSYFTGSVGIGTIDPLWLLHVSTTEASRPASQIENLSTVHNSNPIGLAVRLGSGLTNPDSGDHFINFLRGDSTIIGSISGNGAGGVTYNTTGADFAEYFKRDPSYTAHEEGDILCISQKGGVTRCNEETKTIVGVYSTSAGFVGRSDKAEDPSYVIVGLLGQLPVKVSSENGPVQPGDLLAASSQVGHSAKAVGPGFIVGKALEEAKDGRVLAHIGVSWYDPGLSISASGDSNLTHSPDEFVYDGVLQRDESDSSAANQAQNAAKMALVGLIRAQDVVTQTLSASEIRSAKVVSPIIETDYIVASKSANFTSVETSEIKPQEKDIVINLEPSPQAPHDTSLPSSTPSASAPGALAKLIIKGFGGREAAVFDSEGNATLSGTLAAREVRTDKITVKEIESETVNNLRERLTKLATQTSAVEERSGKTAEVNANELNEIQKTLADLRTNPLPQAQYYQNITPGQNISVDENTPRFDTVAVRNLLVDGQASLDRAFVNSSLTIHNIHIESNALSSSDTDLHLSALERINFFNGAATIARDGTITTEGKLIAKGGVTILNSQFSILDSEAAEVASINASGSAQFNTLAVKQLQIEDKYLEATREGVLISAADNVARGGLPEVALETAGQQVGIGVIPEEALNIYIYNRSLKESSLVYLTPTTSLDDNQLYVAEKNTCQSQGTSCTPYFKVGLVRGVSAETHFNWLIIN